VDPIQALEDDSEMIAQTKEKKESSEEIRRTLSKAKCPLIRRPDNIPEIPDKDADMISSAVRHVRDWTAS
jgi:hypothetical protein